MTTNAVIVSSTPLKPLWWRENLNFFLLALLILFLFRFYCVEFFLIPSQSMYPTLNGHPHSGDRILVNRAAYDFASFSVGAIQRWDVIVFKFPLNTSRNFVKRVTALPGETVEVHASNIWIQQQIATKPQPIQERLLFENGRAESLSFVEFFQQRFQLDPSPKFFRVAPEEDSIHISPQENVSAVYVPHNAYTYDKDTQIQLHFSPMGLTGSFQVTLIVGKIQAILTLFPERIQLKVLEDDSPPILQEVRFKLGFKQAYLLKFSCVDAQIVVQINDQLLFPVFSVRPQGLETESRLFQLDFFQIDCKLHNIRVFYDVRYTREMDHLNQYQVKTGEYFVCGDNSVESDDSRSWRKVFLAVQQNEHPLFYEGQADQSEKMWKEREVVFLDTLGKKYHFSPKTVKVIEKKSFPGVPKSYILGKAWLIIWPPNRIQSIR